MLAVSVNQSRNMSRFKAGSRCEKEASDERFGRRRRGEVEAELSDLIQMTRIVFNCFLLTLPQA